MRRSLLTGLFLVATLLASRAAADVIVVDINGGGDFTELDLAITVAQPGDTVLVKPGNYFGPLNPFGEALIIDKALTVVGDVGGPPLVPVTYIQNLDPGETVIIRNMSFVDSPTAGVNAPSVHIRDNQGTIVFEDCIFSGEESFLFGTADQQVAMVLEDSVGVSATRCIIAAGRGHDSDPDVVFPATETADDGGLALWVIRSNLSLYDCVVTGGMGGADFDFGNGGAAGGVGLRAENSHVYISGGSLEGGQGGGGSTSRQSAQVVGGDGVHLLGGSLLRIVGMTPAAGLGGELVGGGNGPSGQATVVFQGAVGSYAIAPRALELPGILREGEGGDLLLSGQPGDSFALIFSLDALFFEGPGPLGSFLPAPPTLGPINLGPLPGSGQLVLPFTVPSLQGLDTVTFVVQAVFADGPSLLETSPTALTLLSTGF
jgi:hypothetical protein